MAMNEEIEKLEVKISYLESYNEELNAVVIRQGKEISRLKVQLGKLEKKVEDLAEKSGEARPSRKPPHY